MSDPRDPWSDPSRPQGQVPPTGTPTGTPAAGDPLPRVTEAYRNSLPTPSPTSSPGSSLPPRRASVPILPPARSRKRRFARVMSWIAVATSASVLGVSGVGYAVVSHYDGQIDRIDVPGLGSDDGDARPLAADEPQDFLVVGSDSRGDLAAGEGVQGTGEEFVTGQRSDTIILVHLFGGRSEQAQLVSFPRDSYVPIPAFTDPTTGKTTPAHSGKINSAFFLGGPGLLTQTVEGLTGVGIEHYMQIDFNGFKGMVDALGGVEVCLSRPAKEKDSGIDLPAGRSVVRGDQALAFVRQRKELAGGDIGRIERQQQFVGSMVRKVLSNGTLLNPLRLNGFLDVATESLRIDSGLDTTDLRDLALRMRSFSAGGVSFATVPFTDADGRRKNLDGLYESVVLLDEVKAEQLFSALRADTPPGTPATAAPSPAAAPLIVRPSAVRVRVFNGSDVAGLGRRAAQDLAEVGFVVRGAAEQRGTGATGSVVRHGPDKADSARTLAAAVPGATLELDPALGSTLELVVGAQYPGARQVSVAAPTPRPSASAGATAPVKTAAEDPCAA